MNKSIKKLACAIVASIVLLACDDTGTNVNSAGHPAFYFDEEKFKSEWDIWKSQDIKDYKFTLKGKLDYKFFPKAKRYDRLIGLIPMYPYEAKIVVKNSIMDSFEYIGKTPYDIDYSAEYPFENRSILKPEYTSISDMYKKMYDQIKNSELELPRFAGCIISMRYEIKYNQEFHYITSYNPIYEIEPGCILDTTLHEVVVSDFSED
ncbi:MAG: hypothetical protein LBC75_03865 [Fibromonadaceae bacterium]|jgi:hypothetical protein|nr:hypothetical protein [Fibromonadaceae bacterium]